MSSSVSRIPVARPSVRYALLLLLLVPLLLLGAGVGSAAQAQEAQEGTQGDQPTRTVRVGTEGTYPPFTFHSGGASGPLTGYDIEVVRAVAREAGWRLRFTETTFDAIFPALDSDRIDVVANQVTVNPERQARYAFSTPYTYSRGVIVVRKGEEGITSLADLRGKVTAQSSTSNWAEVARDAGARVEAVEGFAQAATLLAQGRVDAIVNDNIAVLDYLASTGSDAVEIAGPAGDERGEQAFAFRDDAGGRQLAQEADTALASLQADGTLRGISEKYFDADVSTADGASIDDVDVGDGRGRSSDWDLIRDTAWPMLVKGVQVTIPLTAICFSVGLVLAVGVALARISASRLLSLPARAFISVIRGTPLLVQLFIVFYGLPELGLKLSPFPAAVIAFSLNVAGYAAEVVRSAILAVPRGQVEAGSALGLRRSQVTALIVLPQAARIAVPPLGNTLLSLLKDTSLAATVLLTELFRTAQVAAAESNRFLALYAFAALYYWIACLVISWLQGRVERRLEKYAT